MTAISEETVVIKIIEQRLQAGLTDSNQYPTIIPLFARAILTVRAAIESGDEDRIADEWAAFDTVIELVPIGIELDTIRRMITESWVN